jgi:hypothetical protein
VPFVVFIVMENKATTKATIKKAHFIASMIPSKLYPIDVIEYIIEVNLEELSHWNSDTIYELQYYLFQFPQKIFYEKIRYFIQTIEVESDGADQLLTIRFMFVGNFIKREIEDIGIQFRDIISEKFTGNLHLKFNRQMEHLDLTILITPLQLINPNKTSEFPDWVMEKIMTNPLTVVPSSFFIEGLHKQLNTSIM